MLMHRAPDLRGVPIRHPVNRDERFLRDFLTDTTVTQSIAYCRKVEIYSATYYNHFYLMLQKIQ